MRTHFSKIPQKVGYFSLRRGGAKEEGSPPKEGGSNLNQGAGDFFRKKY